jgi:hypothetical protein
LSPARPTWTKALDKFAMPARQILRGLSETPLVCLRRVALNAATGLIEIWKPGRRHGQECNSPQSITKARD